MPPAFIETALALLTAHLLADFVFQTKWIVVNKRRPAAFAVHSAIVFALTALALGGNLALAGAVTLAHMIIDAVKVYALPHRLWSYLADQIAHLATIAFAAWLMPDAMAAGFWPPLPDGALILAALICGGIAATRVGEFAIDLLMARYRMDAQPQGLENAGRTIGLLERALIYLMVMIGEPTGIGFLIAAKSILRFDTVSKDRNVSEYVIIGTLASFGWALAMALATQAVINSF